jgi:hypothetical protein
LRIPKELCLNRIRLPKHNFFTRIGIRIRIGIRMRIGIRIWILRLTFWPEIFSNRLSLLSCMFWNHYDRKSRGVFFLFFQS